MKAWAHRSINYQREFKNWNQKSPLLAQRHHWQLVLFCAHHFVTTQDISLVGVLHHIVNEDNNRFRETAAQWMAHRLGVTPRPIILNFICPQWILLSHIISQHKLMATNFLSFLIDTGATITLIDESTWSRCKAHDTQVKPWENQQQLVGDINGAPLQVIGAVTIPLHWKGCTFVTPLVVVKGIKEEAILGLDFLQNHKCVIDCKDHS